MEPQLQGVHTAGVQTDSRLAGEVKALLSAGDRAAACDRFEALVDRHQSRATRIAYYYLRNPADVDEAVQDAFVKAFVHLPSFREELLFELWLTKILVNGCIDRLKARQRRARWFLPTGEDALDVLEQYPSPARSAESTLLAAEVGEQLRAAIEMLPDRQRSVVVLSQLEGHTTREVSHILGLRDATVRVHLFRAIRTLRKRLTGGMDFAAADVRQEASTP